MDILSLSSLLIVILAETHNSVTFPGEHKGTFICLHMFYSRTHSSSFHNWLGLESTLICVEVFDKN